MSEFEVRPVKFKEVQSSFLKVVVVHTTYILGFDPKLIVLST